MVLAHAVCSGGGSTAPRQHTLWPNDWHTHAHSYIHSWQHGARLDLIAGLHLLWPQAVTLKLLAAKAVDFWQQRPAVISPFLSRFQQAFAGLMCLLLSFVWCIVQHSNMRDYGLRSSRQTLLMLNWPYFSVRCVLTCEVSYFNHNWNRTPRCNFSKQSPIFHNFHIGLTFDFHQCSMLLAPS